MAEPTGSSSKVGPAIFFGAFPLLTQTMERLLANREPSAGRQMGDIPGFARGVEQPIFFGAFPLQMQITERPLAERPLRTVERSFEQQTGSIRGLASQAEPPTLSAFPLPMRITRRLLAPFVPSSEQPMQGTTGLANARGLRFFLSRTFPSLI